jgi:multidrug resistance efflux pump
MQTLVDFILESTLEKHQKKLAKLKADIEKRRGLLDLAAEKRKMRKSSARHFQSNSEISHSSKLSALHQQHGELERAIKAMQEKND